MLSNRTAAKKRVVTIVNKWWECLPVLDTLLNANATPANFPWPATLEPSKPAPVPTSPAPTPVPRAVFTMNASFAEIWCIGDLMVQTTVARQSSSEDKARFLPRVIGSADMVVSISTCSSSDNVTSLNGCVEIGTKVFMHDGHPASDPNTVSQWHVGPFDTIIDSPLNSAGFQTIFQSIPASLSSGFAPARNNPAAQLSVKPLYGNTALCSINVSNPAEYNAKDTLTMNAFKVVGDASAIPASVETTHGIVRTASTSPFIFISPIVNRFLMYGQETAANLYPQTTAACMNAGVTLAWLLTSLDQYFAQGD
jgi:hypothetical protein